MKIVYQLLILIATFLFNSTAFSQCQLIDETVLFYNQFDVDTFLTKHSDCNYVYELSFHDDVTDLSGFTQFTSVSYIYFENTSLINDFSGFRNIDTVYGNLGFYDTIGATSLCGFENLKYVGQDLRFEHTTGIQSLNGLESLKQIVDGITINDNIDLKSLDGLQNVTSIGYDDEGIDKAYITITGNKKLNSCCGVQNILKNNFTDAIWNIADNASGCNSNQEVETATCNISNFSCLTSIHSLYAKELETIPTILSNAIQFNFPVNELSIYNLEGLKLINLTKVTNTVDLSSLNAGLYVLSLAIENEVINKRIMVVR